jgi:hypothetical protein
MVYCVRRFFVAPTVSLSVSREGQVSLITYCKYDSLVNLCNYNLIY